MFKINPILQTDSYKVSHIGFTAKGTQVIYSNLTARSFDYFKSNYPHMDGKMVWFGLQYFIKNTLVEQWNDNFFNRPKEEVIEEARRILSPYIGVNNLKHFEELHDLGYLPLEIRALPEGSLVNSRVPLMTIKNTDDRFQWLPNYLETVLSAEIWKITTVATIARQFKQLSDRLAKETTGSTNFVNFQNHDFSFRGQASALSSAANGAAFLLFSNGTDNIPALPWIEYFYNHNIHVNGTPAYSIPASEHSVSCLGIATTDEFDFYKKAVNEYYPNGLVSIVIDTMDYWKVITEMIPALKEDIMKRDGKVVLRPDSGDPVLISAGYEIINSDDFRELETKLGQQTDYELEKSYVIKHNGKYYKFTVKNYEDEDYRWFGTRTINENTIHVETDELRIVLNIHDEIPEHVVKGSIECLWDTFGGTINEQGYKLLDPHIGLIYGDGISYEKADAILNRLKNKGFASINIVFGLGSYALASSSTRDTLGIAIKATAAKFNDKWIDLFKDPKTDNGSKKSAKGLIVVNKVNGEYILCDEKTYEEEQNCQNLTTVFLNGKIVKEYTFDEVRKRANGEIE